LADRFDPCRVDFLMLRRLLHQQLHVEERKDR